MSSWWNDGLSGEDRDEWCAALDTGAIGEDLLITLTDAQRAWLENDQTTTASMGPALQAFIAEECSKRLR